ncbi:MAG: hypothetical protein FWF36_02790 [Propionibacteriaceae bacterium]|nr:hypothetical protein [Propionibacteriaceae bacterium]
MTTRSFLYGDDTKLAAWDGVPLTFQIMVSQGAHIVSDPTGGVALAGDFKAGRERLLAFLDELGQRGLVDRSALAAASANIASAMYRVSPTPESAVLKLTAADGTAELGIQAQALLADVGDVDALIARYLSQWETLAASGQSDAIWLQLGVAQAVNRPAPVARSMGSPSAQSYRHARPVVIERPLGVAVVCIIQIVFGIIVTVLYLVGLSALSSYTLPTGVGVVLVVALLLMIGTVALAFVVFSGSFMARRIFTVLVVISLVVDLFQFLSNPAWSPVANFVLSIVYLVVLYSEGANAYFNQTKH